MCSVYEPLRAWERASVLYFGALFEAFILSGIGPVLERHPALGPIVHSCERFLMDLFGRGKVNAIEQAMAFGFLSHWKGGECMGCCPKICTVLARCLVFYLHMPVYILFGVVMLKLTLRYIEIVNPLFRITVGQMFQILPLSRLVQIGLRTTMPQASIYTD